MSREYYFLYNNHYYTHIVACSIPMIFGLMSLCLVLFTNNTVLGFVFSSFMCLGFIFLSSNFLEKFLNLFFYKTSVCQEDYEEIRHVSKLQLSKTVWTFIEKDFVDTFIHIYTSKNNAIIRKLTNEN